MCLTSWHHFRQLGGHDIHPSYPHIKIYKKFEESVIVLRIEMSVSVGSTPDLSSLQWMIYQKYINK